MKTALFQPLINTSYPKLEQLYPALVTMQNPDGTVNLVCRGTPYANVTVVKDGEEPPPSGYWATLDAPLSKADQQVVRDEIEAERVYQEGKA